MRRPQRRQAGGLRLLAAILAGLVVLVAGAGAVIVLRMTSSPDLGPPPAGPAHGTSESQLAVYTVSQLTGLLRPLGSAHAQVVLSEQDLTVEARLRASDALGQPEVRLRDGGVVVSGQASLFGIGVTAVGHLGVQLTTGPDGLPDVGVVIDQIDAGNLTLPGFLRDAIARQISAQVQLGSLLSADPTLKLLRGQMECVAVGASGLVLGFHQPLTSTDSTACAGH